MHATPLPDGAVVGSAMTDRVRRGADESRLGRPCDSLAEKSTDTAHGANGTAAGEAALSEW